MDWVQTFLVALSMSADAMTVNATNGLREENISKWKLLFASFLFGVFQFVMPVIGYFIGYSFREQLETAIPWIGFALLMLLGIKCIVDWIKEFRHRNDPKEEGEENKGKKITFVNLIVEAIATSIDALCIGFVYLSYEIPDALLVFGIIGITTMVLSFITGLLGKLIGKKLSKWANLISGLVFIAVGIKILVEGLL